MDRSRQFPEELSYDVKHHGPTRMGHTWLHVSAIHPKHGEIGLLSALAKSADPNIPEGQIGSVSVLPVHQRKGVATAMAKRAEQELGIPLSHSEARTSDGDAWAKAFGGYMPPMPPREDNTNG